MLEKLIARYRHCKPGGYLEIAEYEMAVGCDDGTCHEGLALWKFYQVVDKAAMLNGVFFFPLFPALAGGGGGYDLMWFGR